MNPLSVLLPGFEGTELPAWVADRLRAGMAGVCLFGTNVDTPDQVRTLTAAIREANPQAIIAIDEEGGDVSRLYHREGSPFPGNAILGRIDDLELTRAVGEQVGRELAAVGINLTLAPDADVNSSSVNPVIGVRSFGDDARLVARHTAAWTDGVQSTGVAACAKHFPGHGDTTEDSHVALPRVDADEALLRRRELRPFEAAIGAGTLTIMSSHLMVPALDADHVATFSRAILRGVLRDELGFGGAVVSDALDMAGASGDRGIPAAAVAALHGGCDLLCIGTANTAEQIDEIAATIADAISSGELASADAEDAAARVASLAAACEPAGAVEAELGRVPGLTLDRVAQAFTVSDRARAMRDAGDPVAFVQVETGASIAVGRVPWGIFAVDGVEPAVVVRPGDDIASALEALPNEAVPVVVGRDLHLHPVSAQVTAALRHRAPLVVDMGWPDLVSGGIDIATVGASRVAGEALCEWMGW